MVFSEYNFLKLNLVDPASPLMYGIIQLHDHIFFFLNIVLFIVLYVLCSTLFFLEWTNVGPTCCTTSVALREAWQKYYLRCAAKDYYSGLTVFTRLNAGSVLEIVWTVLPSIILLLIAVPSFVLLYATDELIDPSLTIKVIGHQWYWSYEGGDEFNILDSFSYPAMKPIEFDSYMQSDQDLEMGGLRLLETTEPLVLPKCTHIRFLVTSDDVIHSWAVPSLGIKIDAIPGRINQVHTFIKKSGVFYGQCSELCGVNHAFMPIQILALEPDFYNNFLENYLVPSMESTAQQLDELDNLRKVVYLPEYPKDNTELLNTFLKNYLAPSIRRNTELLAKLTAQNEVQSEQKIQELENCEPCRIIREMEEKGSFVAYYPKPLVNIFTTLTPGMKLTPTMSKYIDIVAALPLATDPTWMFPETAFQQGNPVWSLQSAPTISYLSLIQLGSEN